MSLTKGRLKSQRSCPEHLHEAGQTRVNGMQKITESRQDRVSEWLFWTAMSLAKLGHLTSADKSSAIVLPPRGTSTITKGPSECSRSQRNCSVETQTIDEESSMACIRMMDIL